MLEIKFTKSINVSKSELNYNLEGFGSVEEAVKSGRPV